MLSGKLLLLGSLACCMATCTCSQTSSLHPVTSEAVFVGSTPGDSLIKSLLTIPAATKVDFIRWELRLKNKEHDANHFELKVAFGEAQPNTRGFKEGGKKLSFEGEYTVSRLSNRNINGEICQLKSHKLPASIFLVKLNDNLFHLLTPGDRLMVGTGGWSYTLARKDPLTTGSVVLPSLTPSAVLLNDTCREVIFAGRTPCLDFAQQYNYPVGTNCNKLKWKLILHRDAASLPTSYALYWTLHRSSAVEGKWRIIKGSDTNPEVIIYQLDTDKPGESISFLVGDDNIMYFLDKKNRLFTGNEDFSYTLNKIKPQGQVAIESR